MTNNAAIENFIKKVRLAQTTKSKDFRLSLEEAIELVNSIALINNQEEHLKGLETKIDGLIRLLKAKPIQEPQTGGINGGEF